MTTLKAERMKVFFSVLIIFSCVFYSCKNELTSPVPVLPPVSNGLVPLKTGNHWVYKQYVLKADGSIRRVFEPGYEKYVFEFINKNWNNQFISGFVWNSLATDSAKIFPYSPDNLLVKWLCINKSDGLHQTGAISRTDTIAVDYLLYKYPIKEGESWQRPHLVFDPGINEFYVADTQAVTCTDTAAVFDTPFGSFKCHVYRYIISQGDDVGEWLEYNEYFKPGFGIVGCYINSYFPNTNFRQYKYKYVLNSTNVVVN